MTNLRMYTDAGLTACLTGSNPPPLEYFRQLPSVFGLSPRLLRNHHLVYVLILDKPNEESSTCIGSTFKTSNGAYSRVREYRRGGSMPMKVYEAIPGTTIDRQKAMKKSLETTPTSSTPPSNLSTPPLNSSTPFCLNGRSLIS